VQVPCGNQHGSSVDVQAGISQQLHREKYAALTASDGVPDDDLGAGKVEEQGEAVAAADGPPALAGALRRGEARGGDAVGSAQRGEEGGRVGAGDEAQQGRRAVVGAEAAEERGVGDEAAPALADEGGAGEGGRERREADEDLEQELVRQGRQRGRGWCALRISGSGEAPATARCITCIISC
jgi:hypothetical protein